MGRFLRIALPAAATLLLIFASVIWWAMHTGWFMNLVRTRIIAIAERATGGRVELGTFAYDADKVTAEFHGFVIHGNEPPGAPPLLRIQTLQVGLKVLSLWRRDIDIQSLVVERPEIHLLAANGHSNIPTPKLPSNSHNPIQQLLELKIAHVEIRDGLFAVNDNALPLDLTTDHLALNLAYNRAGPSYDVALSLPSTDLKFRKIHPHPIGLVTQAHLFANSLRFDSLHLTSGHSSVITSGLLEHFDGPSANFTLDASLAVDDLAALGDIAELQNGTATAKGSLHFDSETSQFVFTGRAQARHVNYVSKPFTLKDMAAEGDIIANNDGMLIKRATASARGANFAGDASIRRYRFLQVQGQVSHVSLREVGTYLTSQPFPWSGAAAGTAFASATFLQPDANFIIGAQVQITPEPGSIATSGDLGVLYHDHSGEVQFSKVHLTLPHSQVSVDGNLNSALDTTVDSTNLADLTPILSIIDAHIQQSDLPVLNPNGRAHFSGKLRNLLGVPAIQGSLSAANFNLQGQTIGQIDSQFTLSATSLEAPSFKLREPIGSIAGSLSLGLVNWATADRKPLKLNAGLSDLDVVKVGALLSSATLPVMNGVASGTLHLGGSLAEPSGDAKLRIANLDAYGEQINQITLDATLAGSTLKVTQGRVQAGPALLNFSGDFQRADTNWSTGDLHMRADTNGFPLASLSTIQKYLPGLAAQAEAHFDAILRITPTGLSPLRADGTAFLRRVTINKTPYGEATLKAVTQGTSLDLSYSGKLLQTEWNGKAQAKLIAGTPIQGELELGRLDFATLRSLVPTLGGGLVLTGFLQGGLQFHGSLEKPEQMQANLSINDLEISSPVRTASKAQILLRNKSPIQIEAANGVATVRSFEITGNDTSISVTGNAPFIGKQPLNIKAVGKANLQIFSLFDPNVQSSGASEVAVNIGGSLTAPTLTGALQVTNGTFFLAGLPNGLSAVNGTVVFNRNRATIQKMAGRTGGGDLSLSGFVNFGEGSPLVYHLEGLAQNVRVRYANSISVTANSDLRLSGTSTSSILSGNLTVTRVVFTPTADVGNLLAAAGTSASPSGDEGDFLTGLHLDVVVESAPNLQVSTNLSRDVEAEIQLRLRGTPEHPILLGSISANQGDLRVFGTRYTLNRGEVNFVNTVKAEPVLDLDLETQTRGVTVDITISGTASKLNFNYRSDPPLQPRDIIALLTVGRTPGVGTTSNAQGASDASALSSGVNSVVGQAIAPVSNRLSRLFGITNIRIDPFVQGITNTPQARLSVEQQISRDITITYVTNLSQTSEQIFRLEWALNRQYSIVAIRDDNGEFGIDFQYKKRFK